MSSKFSLTYKVYKIKLLKCEHCLLPMHMPTVRPIMIREKSATPHSEQCAEQTVGLQFTIWSEGEETENLPVLALAGL
jgi:hypothetical protein